MNVFCGAFHCTGSFDVCHSQDRSTKDASGAGKRRVLLTVNPLPGPELMRFIRETVLCDDLRH